MYEIRIAQESDLKILTDFIDQHWKKNHIFVNNKELLDWQHYDHRHKQYNFVIGIHKETQVIHGILGFVPLTQFDPEIELNRLCWMAIWKVQDAARGEKLGRRLLSYLEDTIKPNILSTIAASEMSLALYQARGYQIGRLNHYFILNPEKENFYLADVKGYNKDNAFACVQNSLNILEKLSTDDIVNSTFSFSLQKESPQKSSGYLLNRYCRHPFYKYHLYKIKNKNKEIGMIVFRICSHDKSNAIRIVDFIGPSHALHGLYNEWIKLLKAVDSEYIDFYNAGIDENDLSMSGFRRREETDNIIIPNFFEPFLKKNVEIDYMIKIPSGESYRIVKGDSDQDRPNIIQ